MTPEELEALKNDPTFGPLLNTEAGQALLMGQQEQSPAGQDYFTAVAPFAPLEGSGIFAGGTAQDPELAAQQRFAIERAEGQGFTRGEGYVTEQSTGRVLFDNGVVYDPATGQVSFPPGKKVPGSEDWRREVIDWDKKRVQKWRSTLNNLGYGVAEKGGVDQPFIAALQRYHTDRYSNYGRIVPAESQVGRRQEARQAIDRVQLAVEAEGWVNQAYGREASESETEFWADKFMQKFLDLVDKGVDPSQAAQGATTRVQKQITGTPEGVASQEQLETLEEKTTIRDHLFSIGQLASI